MEETVGIVVMIGALGLVAPAATASVSASAYWTTQGCGPQECGILAHGDHSATVGSAPAQGTLYVDGPESTCGIGPLGGDCSTLGPGRTAGVDECHDAIALTESRLTSESDRSKATWCGDEADAGEWIGWLPIDCNPLEEACKIVESTNNVTCQVRCI